MSHEIFILLLFSGGVADGFGQAEKAVIKVVFSRELPVKAAFCFLEAGLSESYLLHLAVAMIEGNGLVLAVQRRAVMNFQLEGQG